MQRPLIWLLPAILLSLFATATIAEEDSETWWTITWENDFIADDDSGYTNGLGVSWGHGPVDEFSESTMPSWLYQVSQWLPYSRDAQNSHAVSYRIAQLMYTPDDIREPELIEDDRPYAGILLWTTNLHSYNDSLSNRYWASFGMVGPASGAEQVQEVIHEIIGVNTAKGWDNQLSNEFTFLLSNERLHRLRAGTFSNALEYDLIGMTEMAAGTLRSEIGAGGGFRFGKNLQQSFPAASLIPGRSLNPMVASPRHDWHVFMNLYGRYVFNDITLDGTYFSDSHSVELTNEQFFVSVGGAWHHREWGMAVSIQDSTRTFEERRENTLFGTFRLRIAGSRLGRMKARTPRLQWHIMINSVRAGLAV